MAGEPKRGSDQEGVPPEPVAAVGPEARVGEWPEPSHPVATRNTSSRQLLRNSVANYGALLVNILTGLLLTPVLLHHLGVAGFGVMSVLTTGATYMGLLDAGVSTTVSQRVAHFGTKDDREGLVAVLASARVFFLGSSVVAVVVVVAITPFLGRIFELGHYDLRNAQIAFLLLGVATVTAFITSTSSAVLFGSGRNDTQSYVGAVNSVVQRVGVMVVALLGGGLIGVVGTTTGTALIFAVVTVMIAKHLYPHTGWRLRPARKAVLKDVLRSGSRTAIAGLGGTLSYGLDTLIIGALVPIAEVAPYSVAVRATGFVRVLSTSGTNALFPGFAHTYAMGRLKETYRMFRIGLLISMGITMPMLLAVCIFGHDLLVIWLGTIPPRTLSVLIALSIVSLCQLPGNQCFILLTALDKNKTLARISIPLAITNIAMSVVLTIWLGPVGPAIGSIPQAFLADTIYLPILACRALDQKARDLLRAVGGPVVVMGAASLLVGLGAREVIAGGPRWLGIPAAGLTVLAGWAAALPIIIRTESGLWAKLRAKLPWATAN